MKRSLYLILLTFATFAISCEKTDTVITADALNCQKEIVGKIIDKKGNYVLAVTERISLLTLENAELSSH